MLYSKIIDNDMLHYGYFKNIDISSDEISIKEFQNAQMNYIKLIINQIKSKESKILDVGCGMGGLSKVLKDNKYEVESVTPDDNQFKYITLKYPDLVVHHKKFEDFNSENKFDVIINSESIQYINLDTAFKICSKIINDDGRWIIVDYFRKNDDGINKSGHLLTNFLNKVDRCGWKVTYSEDITQNVLPTLKFAMLVVDRFIKPIASFASIKIKIKQAWLYYLLRELRNDIKNKAEKELSSLDPIKFSREKKYMLYVLEKK